MKNHRLNEEDQFFKLNWKGSHGYEAPVTSNATLAIQGWLENPLPLHRIFPLTAYGQCIHFAAWFAKSCKWHRNQDTLFLPWTFDGNFQLQPLAVKQPCTLT